MSNPKIVLNHFPIEKWGNDIENLVRDLESTLGQKTEVMDYYIYEKTKYDEEGNKTFTYYTNCIIELKKMEV